EEAGSAGNDGEQLERQSMIRCAAERGPTQRNPADNQGGSKQLVKRQRLREQHDAAKKTRTSCICVSRLVKLTSTCWYALALNRYMKNQKTPDSRSPSTVVPVRCANCISPDKRTSESRIAPQV